MLLPYFESMLLSGLAFHSLIILTNLQTEVITGHLRQDAVRHERSSPTIILVRNHGLELGRHELLQLYKVNRLLARHAMQRIEASF